jgi:hypothetical protein
MAWTQSDIDRLKKAIGSGVKQVMEGGRMVTYNTVADMVRALAMMEAEVNGTSRRMVEQVAFRRGDE